MFMRMLKYIPIVLILVYSANAQVGVGSFQSIRSVQVGGGYQYWSAGNDQIRQFAIPVTLNWSVNDNLKLDVTSTPAFNSYVSQATYDLGGLSDTRLRGAYLFDNETMMFTFGVNLPTGKSALSQDEFQVASKLAYHAFDFASPILGQGMDISAGFVMVRDWQDFIIGFGAGFLYRGAYQPFSDSDLDYNPGEEFSISGGVDYYTGRNSKLMFDLGYTIYGDDKANDLAVFKSGNRISLQAIWAIDQKPISWLFMARNRIQSKNQAGSGDLVPERLNSNGNEFDMTGMGFLTWQPGTKIRGLVNFKLYSDNAYGLGGATLMGLGGGLNQAITPVLYFDGELRFYFGSINSGTENTGLSGFQAMGGFKVYL